MRKIVKSIFKLALLIFLLDFIPIKFAVKLENAVPLKSNEYLCSFAQVTGGNWEVENCKNEQLFFENLIGTNPMEVLDENFSTDYLEPSGNKYIFSGEIVKKDNSIYDLNVYEWDIVYPIQRKSLRMLYAPKHYLTIYDYSGGQPIGDGHDSQ